VDEKLINGSIIHVLFLFGKEKAHILVGKKLPRIH
jgi:hypothetical protein